MNFIKKIFLIIVIFLFVITSFENASAQCSICAKTTQQLGEKPAKGFNSGIIYLMLAPFAIMAYIGYRWYQRNGNNEN
ncbi:MAG: hypothetical protein ABIQ56_07460 [Chitinophagaceae bacterium]